MSLKFTNKSTILQLSTKTFFYSYYPHICGHPFPGGRSFYGEISQELNKLAVFDAFGPEILKIFMPYIAYDRRVHCAVPQDKNILSFVDQRHCHLFQELTCPFDKGLQALSAAHSLILFRIEEKYSYRALRLFEHFLVPS